jgi:UDP-glucose 4-epimerase
VSDTVLLTGAAGFLGGHARRALRDAGWNVLCCVRQANDSRLGDFEAVACDLNEPAQVLLLQRRCRPQAVVHLASDVGLDARDERLFAPNVLATGCIAYLAHAWKARLIFASSVMVHGARTERIDRDSEVRPDTAYGRSKAVGEELIALSGAEHAILRIAGIFGARGPRHLGLNRVIDAALEGIAPTQMGAGEARRNYVYVKDAALAIVAALQRDLRSFHHLAGSEVLSVSEMMKTVCDTLLPGTAPVVKEGARAADQVVAPSAQLPATRSLRDALLDIRDGGQSCA